jgi:hypothetical protein
MTARRSGTATALLVGLALVVGACSGNAATPGPTGAASTGVPSTEAAPSEAPGESGLPGFSFALPSFTADTDLESKFPAEIGGEKLQVLSMTGSDFIGANPAGNEIAPVLSKLGKSPSDLSVAFGGTMSIAVVAFRIKGVPADQFLNAYTQTAPQGANITDASLGGKSVKKVVTPDSTGTTYIYLKDDVIWTVSSGSEAATDALLNEAFSKLP